MKILLLIRYHFSKELIFVSLGSKYLKKYLLMKILKKFSEYIRRQLKYDLHRIRSTVDISLEIILKPLIVLQYRLFH